MSKPGALIGAIFAMSAAVAHAQAMPETFNLICTGMEVFMEQGTGMMAKMSTPKPFSVTYRLDLKNKRICGGDCTLTFAIVEVTPTLITLEKKDLEEAGTDYVSRVNRESGKYQSIERYGLGNGQTWKLGSFSTVRDGTCEAMPFTGFPRSKF